MLQLIHHLAQFARCDHVLHRTPSDGSVCQDHVHRSPAADSGNGTATARSIIAIVFSYSRCPIVLAPSALQPSNRCRENRVDSQYYRKCSMVWSSVRKLPAGPTPWMTSKANPCVLTLETA